MLGWGCDRKPKAGLHVPERLLNSEREVVVSVGMNGPIRFHPNNTER